MEPSLAAALHRIMTGLTARRLWERTAIWDILGGFRATPVRQIAQVLRMDVADVQGIIDAGPGWADEVKQTAPEEFWEWIETTTERLKDQASEVAEIVAGEAFGHRGRDRKDIARDIADHPYRGLVFACLDGKPWAAQAWAAVRPDAEKPFVNRGEDVA